MTPRSGMSARQHDRSRVHPEVWFKIFHEPRLLVCLIEVLKNGFDWGAQVVNLITDEGRERLRHVDDGCGMNAANREAFLSVGYTTAGGEQSGAFGTGAKKIIFTFASFVRVVTASEDEPDLVYVGEFTPMELAEDYTGLPKNFWKPQKKSARTWPHEHVFGTDITYTLKDPRSRSLYRDEQLAQKLSDRLDYVLIEGGMVLVNGQRLPAKKIKGRIYSFEFPAHPAMGRVKLEFYRPANKSGDEDLRLTGRSIGEVSFRHILMNQLTEDQRDQVPPLFLEGEVCGLITAGFLNDHITERRDSYDALVADDERTMELIRMLRQVEADVANHLGIKLRHLDEDEAQGQAEALTFVALMQRRFNPEGEVPPGYAGPNDAEGPGRKRSGSRTPPKGTELPRLVLGQDEYAIGETLIVELQVPGGSTDGFYFYLGQAHAKVEETADGRARLICDQLGRGLILATNPKTGQSARAEYDVVYERSFHLSARGPIGVQVGSRFTIEAINVDKLRGPVSWQLDGDGDLTPRRGGRSAVLVPARAGAMSIIATDSQDASTSDSCAVLATPSHGPGQLVKIRDRFFAVEFTEANIASHRKPATIVPIQRGGVNRLIFNPMAPGYAAALRAGTLKEILAYATALEFVKWFETSPDDFDASDYMSVMLVTQNAAAELFGEMLGD